MLSNYFIREIAETICEYRVESNECLSGAGIDFIEEIYPAMLKRFAKRGRMISTYCILVARELILARQRAIVVKWESKLFGDILGYQAFT